MNSLKSPRRNFNISTPKSARNDQFKNPILGIEIQLIKDLQTVENEYNSNSYQKKKVLIKALQDIADTNLGFRKQILYCINLLDPKTEINQDNERLTTVTDLVRVQNELRELKKKKDNIQNENSILKNKLLSIKNETEEIEKKTFEMKQKLFNESDYFTKSRQLANEMKELENTFQNMFNNKKDDEFDSKFKQLIEENDNLRKELSKLKFELEITTQITKRLKFIDQKYG